MYYSLSGIKGYREKLNALIEISAKYNERVIVITPLVSVPGNYERLEFHPEFSILDFMNAVYGARMVLTDSYIVLCIHLLHANLAAVWSTNTFYPSVFCTIGAIAIFSFCMNLEKSIFKPFWKAVQYITSTSIGIWVFHPLMLRFLVK